MEEERRWYQKPTQWRPRISETGDRGTIKRHHREKYAKNLRNKNQEDRTEKSIDCQNSKEENKGFEEVV